MSGVVIDESRWPRVYATWPSTPVSDADFEKMVAAMSRFTRRGEPFVVIHDARHASRPTPKQRALAATQQERDAEGTKRFLRGVALIVSNSLIAGAVRAINWIAPPPYPQKLFSSMEAAEAWATKRLAGSD